MSRVSMVAGSALIALSAAAAYAQAPALDVRMGLWEVTNVSTLGGQMPQMDLSKVPPEQRARIEQSMKAMMGSHTHVVKSCITKEKFEKSAFLDDQQGRNCTQKITTNTRSTFEAALTCAGEHPMTGQMHLDAVSPTAVKGAIKSTSTEDGRTMNIDMVLTGKWLGADCGNVK
jgi:uncharacterized protein DUF3617